MPVAARYIDLKYVVMICSISITAQTLCLILCVLWSISASIWLMVAYMLEFHGWSLYLQLWLASLWFHIVNVLCIAFIILSIKSSPRARGLRLSRGGDDSDKD